MTISNETTDREYTYESENDDENDCIDGAPEGSVPMSVRQDVSSQS